MESDYAAQIDQQSWEINDDNDGGDNDDGDNDGGNNDGDDDYAKSATDLIGDVSVSDKLREIAIGSARKLIAVLTGSIA